MRDFEGLGAEERVLCWERAVPEQGDPLGACGSDPGKVMVAQERLLLGPRLMHPPELMHVCI